MRNKICPKCGCIFDEEKRECIDCGMILRTATAEELDKYNKKLRKNLHKLSDHSENTVPELWQYIGALALLIVGLLLWRFSDNALIFAFNVLFAIGVMVPKLKINISREQRAGKRIWFKFYYPQAKYKLALGFAAFFDFLLVFSIIFQQNQ